MDTYNSRDFGERLEIGFELLGSCDDALYENNQPKIPEGMHELRIPHKLARTNIRTQIRSPESAALIAHQYNLLTPNSVLNYALPVAATAERGGLTYSQQR